MTETYLGLFVTTKYMTYLSDEKDLFLTNRLVGCKQNSATLLIFMQIRTNEVETNVFQQTEYQHSIKK